MLRKIWHWLVSLFQRLFGISTSSENRNNPPPPAKLSDADYESVFMQLLEKVEEGWSKGEIKSILIAKSVKEADLVTWLRGFGEKLQASDAQHQELALRMRRLGEVGCGEIKEVAQEIAKQLLGREEETNHRGTEDTEQGEGRENASSLEQQEAEALFYQGNEQAMAGDFVGAIASYDKALQFQPDFHEAWISRGMAVGSSTAIETALTLRFTLPAGATYPHLALTFNNPELDLRGFKGTLATYRQGLKLCSQDTHPEGWGMLSYLNYGINLVIWGYLGISFGKDIDRKVSIF